jgi:hypothetical protein
MNLVMFDIDGTLTNTNAMDEQCHVHALSEVFQVDANNIACCGSPLNVSKSRYGCRCLRAIFLSQWLEGRRDGTEGR